MDLLAFFRSLSPEYYTLAKLALGVGMLGVVSGALGAFAVLRRQSLLGDAISHAALPGIALAFLVTGSKEPLLLLFGAAVAGWMGTLVVLGIVAGSRVKYDSALGLVIAVFYGLGVVLLTFIQRLPTASKAGLDKVLLGQTSGILERDVLTVAGLSALALLLLLLFWKELKLLSFDPDFGASLGFPMRGVDVLFLSLLVVAIVLGLQTVGVVLMSAMIVAPAVAARQWTDRLALLVVLAGLVGASAGVGGAVLSNTATRLSAGPVIVLCTLALVVVSLLLAPNRGLLWEQVRHWRQRRQLRLDAVLGDLYALAAQHADPEHGHAAAVLQAMSVGAGGVRPSLEELSRRGWARRLGGDEWALTPAGRAEAERRSKGLP
jgi:manganese/zinc/iron transport system permease protein